MNPFTCIIIEDEQLAINILKGYIDQITNLVCLGSFYNSLDANEFLQKNNVDILFVDIEIPGMKGTEFVECLNKDYKVIFTTAYENYAVSAFELEAIDYLVKPIPFKRFMKTINKIIRIGDNEHIEKNNSIDKLFIKIANKILNINIKDILYINSMQRYVQIHTRDNTYTCLLSMYKLLESLPKEDFYRVHKSYAVNLNHIDYIEGNYIEINKEKIPISKAQKEDFFEYIHNKKNILSI